MHRRQFADAKAMAAMVGCHRSALQRILRESDRTIGADILFKVHDTLKVSLDWLADSEPKNPRWFDPDFHPDPREDVPY